MRLPSSSGAPGFRPKRQTGSTTEVQSQRRADFQRPQIHLSARNTSKDDSHASSVEMESPEHRFGAAAGADDPQVGRLKREKTSQRPRGRVSVKSCEFLSHRLSPVGPNRSVLMANSLWPRPTNWSATVSTNEVGPHTKIRGSSAGWNPHSTSMALSTRRVCPSHPAGAPRVSVCMRRKPSRFATSRSSSPR